MSLASNLSDDIPGLVKAALIFKGETPSGKSASLAILTDGEEEQLLDLSNGLNPKAPGLTQAMKSYLSGLSQVGQILKARRIEDEDGVTEDDLERAALLFAFPRVGQNPKALSVLKSHLDALQDQGILARVQMDAPAAAKPAAKVEEPAAEVEEETAEDDDTDVAKAAALTLVGATVAAANASDSDDDAEDDAEEASDDSDAVEATADDADDSGDAATDDADDTAEAKSDDDGETAEDEADAPTPIPVRPTPAQVAQAKLNQQPRKPSFFGR